MKEQIQQQFVLAMKAKDVNAKAALSSLKAKITEAEKANGNQPLDESQLNKVITSAIKQRKQSYEAFLSAGRKDLAEKEYDEILVIESFLPKQMSESEIDLAVREIIQGLSVTITNPNVLVGKTMGEFNKKYSGKADSNQVMTIIKKVAAI